MVIGPSTSSHSISSTGVSRRGWFHWRGESRSSRSVAGALIFLGLFTRIWGLLLAILIGGSFALTSVQQNEMFQMNPFHWRSDSALYYEMFFQAATFVLALSMFLVGPGILSLDGLVFGRKKAQLAAKPAASA